MFNLVLYFYWTPMFEWYVVEVAPTLYTKMNSILKYIGRLAQNTLKHYRLYCQQNMDGGGEAYLTLQESSYR